MRATRWMKVTAVVAMVALGGCDQGDPVAPQQLGPRLAGGGAVMCSVAGTSGVQLLDTGLELTLAFTVARDIGVEGGAFGIGASRMEIPAGAVDGPTRFTLNLTVGRYILAELRAVSLETGEEVVYFNQPVTVEIGYQRLQGVDPAQLGLVWLVDGTVDGAMEVVSTTVDSQRKRIIGQLDHFSVYAVAIN